MIDDALTGIVFVDADGTITGDCGASIVGSSPLLRDGSCNYNAGWNAYVCPSSAYPHGALDFYDMDGIIYQGFAETEYWNARDLYDAVVYRVHDGVSTRIEPDMDRYNGNLVQAERRYGTNLMVNTDYLVKIRNNVAVPKFSLNWIGSLGEYINVAIPYPAGTTFQVLRESWSTTVLTEVYSKAALAYNTYFWDSTNNLLWIHVAFYINLTLDDC